MSDDWLDRQAKVSKEFLSSLPFYLLSPEIRSLLSETAQPPKPVLKLVKGDLND